MFRGFLFYTVFMNHCLYIIYSEAIDKYYVGETYDLEKRIEMHNTHSYKRAFTKAADDWYLKLAFNCKNREDALFLERFIKRMKSKKFIQKVILNPDILKDILTKR